MQSNKSELVINNQTARILGLTVPRGRYSLLPTRLSNSMLFCCTAYVCNWH